MIGSTTLTSACCFSLVHLEASLFATTIEGANRIDTFFCTIAIWYGTLVDICNVTMWKRRNCALALSETQGTKKVLIFILLLAESVPILATSPAVQNVTITIAVLSNTLHLTLPRLLKPNDHLSFIALICLTAGWAINHLLARKLSRGLHIIHISNLVVIQVVSWTCYSFMSNLGLRTWREPSRDVSQSIGKAWIKKRVGLI